MRVRQLIELLEETATEVGDDAVIQLATQQHYPLRYHLRGVFVPEADYAPDGDGEDDDQVEDRDERNDTENGQPVVWLVEGNQHHDNPYGVPTDAFSDARTAW